MCTIDSFATELHLQLCCSVNHKQKQYPLKKGVKDLVRLQEIGGCRLGWWGDLKRSKRVRVELTRGVPLPAWEKKTRPLGKNDVPDTHGALLWGLVTP